VDAVPSQGIDRLSLLADIITVPSLVMVNEEQEASCSSLLQPCFAHLPNLIDLAPSPSYDVVGWGFFAC